MLARLPVPSAGRRREQERAAKVRLRQTRIDVSQDVFIKAGTCAGESFQPEVLGLALSYCLPSPALLARNTREHPAAATESPKYFAANLNSSSETTRFGLTGIWRSPNHASNVA